MSVTQWKEAILAGWEHFGTGKPLDPKTVEYLAVEFSKPLNLPRSPYWHGKEPVCEFMTFDMLWRPYGSMMMNPLVNLHRHIFMEGADDKYWWDGSCRVTALVKEGPKAIVKWEPR